MRVIDLEQKDQNDGGKTNCKTGKNRINSKTVMEYIAV